MAHEENKREANEELTRTIEFEMAAKRAEWQRSRDRFRKLRMLSFSFLSLVIVGTVIALLAIFSRLNEAREQREAFSPSPTVSPQSPPPR
jgi:hypothetical protein